MLLFYLKDIYLIHCLNTSCVQTFLDLQARAAAKLGNSNSSFLKATTTTLLHTIVESEKACYVAHINSYLRDDPFLKEFLPIDPKTNALFDLAKDGVLLWYFIRVATYKYTTFLVQHKVLLSEVMIICMV